MLFIVTLILAIIIIAVLRQSNSASIINSHWQHYFDEFTYSSQDFYQSLEKVIQEKNIPSASTKRVNHSEGGLFSANREYLRVERENIVFDICAAPFAKGFFISSWQGEMPTAYQRFLAAIPLIGRFLEKEADKKTFYQLDFEQMFCTAVHSSVLETIRSITDDMGIRDLSETERMLNKVVK